MYIDVFIHRIKYLSFSLFPTSAIENVGCSTSESSTSQQHTYTNSRNMFWTINFLRILQMLTKRKTNRIMLLVQYKSSVIMA